MSDKEKATGGRGKQRQKPAQQQQDGAAPRTGGRGKQRER